MEGTDGFVCPSVSPPYFRYSRNTKLMLWKTYLVFWVLWTTSSSMSLEKPIKKELRTTAGVYKIRDWDEKVMVYRRGSF